MAITGGSGGIEIQTIKTVQNHFGQIDGILLSLVDNEEEEKIK